jgi:carboxypeptidase Taq
MTAYRNLAARFERIGALNEALAILHWDHSAMMPSGGSAARASQLSVIELLAHEQLTDPAMGDLIEEAASANDLDPWQVANVTEMRRDWIRGCAIPASLVEERVAAQIACEMVWREARPANDFARVLPALERLRGVMVEVGEAKSSVTGSTLYDALLDDYEPGGTSVEIDRLFDGLVGFLPGLIDEILAHQRRRPAPLVPEGPFPQAAQQVLAQQLMAAAGFDFSHGRLDISLHPFCGGTPDDVRITTRYALNDFRRAMMAVLHETGHALYEQGLPSDWRRQPVGRARSLGVHESQSLLIEMQACRSREFLEFAAPLFREAFGGSGPAWDADNLYRLGATAERSLIRTEADEVTYPAHVILRYRLERAMLAGDLALKDLPGAWRDGMAALVGIVPPDDRDGCLQDIHWYCGLWGYFPTYTLGALTAAQLFDAAKTTEPGIPAAIAKGDFTPLLAWLRRNIHSRASSVPTATIIQDATGKALDAGIWRRHIERRYLAG